MVSLGKGVRWYPWVMGVAGFLFAFPVSVCFFVIVPSRSEGLEGGGDM
jgi:hypothetical protein